MSKTDKDNKHVKKHTFSTKCPEKNCTYCHPNTSRKNSNQKALKDEDEAN